MTLDAVSEKVERLVNLNLLTAVEVDRRDRGTTTRPFYKLVTIHIVLWDFLLARRAQQNLTEMHIGILQRIVDMTPPETTFIPRNERGQTRIEALEEAVAGAAGGGQQQESAVYLRTCCLWHVLLALDGLRVRQPELRSLAEEVLNLRDAAGNNALSATVIYGRYLPRGSSSMLSIMELGRLILGEDRERLARWVYMAREDGSNSMHVFSMNRRRELQELLKMGTEVMEDAERKEWMRAVTTQGANMLHYCCTGSYGDIGVLAQVLEMMGGVVEELMPGWLRDVNSDGETVLHVCARYQGESGVTELLKKRKELMEDAERKEWMRAVTSFGEHALHLCARHQDGQVVRELWKMGGGR